MNEHEITDLASLERLYGTPGPTAIHKQIAYIDANYRQWIEASPFVALATCGERGLDVSPRGDPAGFVTVQDAKTLLLPDRRGNNRIDSLRNIVQDARVALLFLIPGVGETLRVNGRARISVDPQLLARFAVDGKLPRTVLVIDVDAVFFQCARALARSRLWDRTRHIARSALPSPGAILQALSAQTIDGEQYDRELPARQASTLY